MYLSLQSLLPLQEKGPSVADMFVAALKSPQAVRDLLPDVDAHDPGLQRLQRVRQVGHLLIDLWGVDMHLSEQEIGKIVQGMRDHWHLHGFGVARLDNPVRWLRSAHDYGQPVLYWRSLSLQHGWDLIGGQLRATERDIFRYLVDQGTVTVAQVARNATIFSQRPTLSDPHVQMEIALRSWRPGPPAYARSEAARILQDMHRRRLVIERQGTYSIVRPVGGSGF